MSEHSPTTHEHLNALTERGAHDVRTAAEKKMKQLHHGEGLQPLYDESQVIAERPLHDIAKFTELAQNRLGISASPEEVAQRALEEAAYYVIVANKDRTRNQESESSADEACDAAISLISMTALDQADGVLSADQAVSLKHLMENGQERVLRLAAKEADDRGLAVKVGESYELVTKVSGVEQLLSPPLIDFIRRFKVARESLLAIKDAPLPEGAAPWDSKPGQFGAVAELNNMVSLLKISTFNSETLLATLKKGEYSVFELNDLLKEVRLSVQEYYDKDRCPPDEPEGFTVIENVPIETLRSMYLSADPSESLHVHAILQAVMDYGDWQTKKRGAALLASIYESDTYSLAKNQQASQDSLVKDFIESGGLRNLLLEGVEAENKEGESNGDFTETTRHKQEQFLEYLGLSAALVSDVERSLDEKTMMKDEEGWTLKGEKRRVDASKVQSHLAKIGLNVEALGVELVESVYEKCGIINVGDYTVDQLKRMYDFSNGDKELVENLRNGDVTVVFKDGAGDHNNALSSVPNTYEKPSGRTLFFEMDEPKDFIRYKIMLRRMGVQPSTVVMAVHGAPGYMGAGEGKNRFVITNADAEQMRQAEEKDGIKRVVLKESSWMESLASNMMQPSRGIDDTTEMTGSMLVVLDSCSQARARTVDRIDSEGNRMSKSESTGETLSRVLHSPNLAVVANPVNGSLRKNSDGGAEFTGSGKPVEGKKFALDNHGNVVETSVTVIPLNRVAEKTPPTHDNEEILA